MKWFVAGAAAAALSLALSGAASASSVCTNDCNHSYSTCNSLNGGEGQQVCMPKWMQCKKACSAPMAKGPTKIANITPAPKPKH